MEFGITQNVLLIMVHTIYNLVMLSDQEPRKETFGYNKQTFGYIYSFQIVELYIIKNSNNESNKDL